jgi:hypothetical protein
LRLPPLPRANEPNEINIAKNKKALLTLINKALAKLPNKTTNMKKMNLRRAVLKIKLQERKSELHKLNNISGIIIPLKLQLREALQTDPTKMRGKNTPPPLNRNAVAKGKQILNNREKANRGIARTGLTPAQLYAINYRG